MIASVLDEEKDYLYLNHDIYICIQIEREREREREREISSIVCIHSGPQTIPFFLISNVQHAE